MLFTVFDTPTLTFHGRQQLENWFRNQQKKVGNANTPATSATMSIIQRILKVNASAAVPISPSKFSRREMLNSSRRR
jgi:hypothetical protein